MKAFEMWMYRKILKVPYTAHITNDEVIKRVKESGRSLKKNIIKRKIQYFGNISKKRQNTKNIERR